MDSTIKAKWLEALRSGDYTQGKNYLHIVDAGDYYCCLGVLCEIALAEGVAQATEPVRSYSGVQDRYVETVAYAGVEVPVDSLYFSAAGGVLPGAVATWAGIEDRNPEVKIPGDTRTLSGLNDEGKTFDEIADLIEEYL